MVCWYRNLPSALREENSCSSSTPPRFLHPCFSQVLQLDHRCPHPQAQSYPVSRPAQTTVGRMFKAKNHPPNPCHQVPPFLLSYLCGLGDSTNNPHLRIQAW